MLDAMKPATTSVDETAAELYQLPPEEFTAARDAQARAAKAAGDRELAAAIAALRKPTVSAWLVNLLVRRYPAEIESFVELGADLRAATAALSGSELSGSELRELGAHRHRLVQALVAQTRGIAAAEGRRVGEDALRGVEETLHAALADEEVAEHLLGGRLTTAVSRTGFTGAATEGKDQTKARANSPTRQPRATQQESGGRRSGPSSQQEPSRQGVDRQHARRVTLQRQLAEAWAAARDAADERDRHARRLDESRLQAAAADRERHRLTADLQRAKQEVDRLANELAEAERAMVAAHDAVTTAERGHREADRQAERSRRKVSDLQSRLDDV
jgi:hypothetical protein